MFYGTEPIARPRSSTYPDGSDNLRGPFNEILPSAWAFTVLARWGDTCWFVGYYGDQVRFDHGDLFGTVVHSSEQAEASALWNAAG